MSIIENNNILYFFKILFISLIVVLITIFFMSKKENLDFDEIGTYGITNNTFQLDIEDNVEYNGEELLLKYASVKEGNEFNFKNVFDNQRLDTHPPFYYIFINIVCSINKGNFSIWYGLIINIIFMVVLFWEMKYIIRLITDSEMFSLFVSIISLFFYGFINMYVFTRMYVMLSTISLLFVMLIFKYILKIKNKFENIKISEDIKVSNNTSIEVSLNKKDSNFAKYDNKFSKDFNNIVNNSILHNDILFLVFFYIICVFGILTQYHFMVMAGIYSLFFGIYLMYKKDYKFLVLVIVTGILSILTAYFIFPDMITHLFGSNSLHGFKSEELYQVSDKLIEFYLSLVKSFSGNLILFTIVLSGCFILLILLKNIYLILIFISLVLYYIVISVTATFIFARYLYNIYPLLIIFISSTIYLACRKYIKMKSSIIKYLPIIISLFILIILCIFSRYKSVPFSLNKGDSLFHNYLYQNKDVKTILLYRTFDSFGNSNSMSGTSKWKLPRPLYSLKDMNSLLFCDVDNMSDLVVEKYKNEKKVFVIIYTTENDDALLNRTINKLNSVSYEKGLFIGKNKIYFNDYYHMYLLTKN